MNEITSSVSIFPVLFACLFGREEQFVDLYKEFEPSLINSTVYIMSMAMQMATFAINYKVCASHIVLPDTFCFLPLDAVAGLIPQGHPFMESLSENRPLLWSIALSGLAIVGLLTGSSPEFNEQFALVEIPTEVIRTSDCLWFFSVC